jgi:hypothetical protein
VVFPFGDSQILVVFTLASSLDTTLHAQILPPAAALAQRTQHSSPTAPFSHQCVEGGSSAEGGARRRTSPLHQSGSARSPQIHGGCGFGGGMTNAIPGESFWRRLRVSEQHRHWAAPPPLDLPHVMSRRHPNMLQLMNRRCPAPA